MSNLDAAQAARQARIAVLKGTVDQMAANPEMAADYLTTAIHPSRSIPVKARRDQVVDIESAVYHSDDQDLIENWGAQLRAWLTGLDGLVWDDEAGNTMDAHRVVEWAHRAVMRSYNDEIATEWLGDLQLLLTAAPGDPALVGMVLEVADRLAPQKKEKKKTSGRAGDDADLGGSGDPETNGKVVVQV